jgi:hypothetical protein
MDLASQKQERATTEGTNWRVDKIVERVVSITDTKNITVSDTQFKNDRGATLFRLGAGRGLQEKFACNDGDVSLEFLAFRSTGPKTG